MDVFRQLAYGEEAREETICTLHTAYDLGRAIALLVQVTSRHHSVVVPQALGTAAVVVPGTVGVEVPDPSCGVGVLAPGPSRTAGIVAPDPPWEEASLEKMGQTAPWLAQAQDSAGVS